MHFSTVEGCIAVVRLAQLSAVPELHRGAFVARVLVKFSVRTLYFSTELGGMQGGSISSMLGRFTSVTVCHINGGRRCTGHSSCAESVWHFTNAKWQVYDAD